MSPGIPQIEQLTREEVIGRLRSRMLRMTDDDHCMCDVAARRNVFCAGFRRYSDAELRERYFWIVRRRPDISREELETLGNRWQLSQQEVRELPLACDVQTELHDTCRGWDDMTDEDLTTYYRQIVGSEIRVLS